MSSFTRIKQYKAKPPLDTVEQIRSILAGCGIKIAEEKRMACDPDVASCRIWLSDSKVEAADFGTNGKGMTEEYALASAYGEMMERLQNMFIFGEFAESAWQNGLTDHYIAPDEEWMNEKEVFAACNDVLIPLMHLDAEKAGTELISDSGRTPVVPYYDVFADRQIMLPHKLLRMAAGSNGMSAGNTFKEAFIQGISEIYERAAVTECYIEPHSVPRIHPECFEGTGIFEKLETLRSKGYDYSILNLSLDRGYPVCGLVLEKGGRKAFKAGADPCPVTALERCLTEMFQGSEEEVNRLFHNGGCKSLSQTDDRSARMRICDNERAFHTNGSGLVPECLLQPADIFDDVFPGPGGVSEEEDYRYLISLTEQLGYHLFIRDCSFLGFPSYHFIIPEISNYLLPFENGFDLFHWGFEMLPGGWTDPCTEECGRILNRLFEKYRENLIIQDWTVLRVQ